MREPFEEALQALLDRYADADRDEVISALELALMAQREQTEPDEI